MNDVMKINQTYVPEVVNSMKATNYSGCRLEFEATSIQGEWAFRIGGEGGMQSIFCF